MTDRDLTPEEARAEVEAFLGERWMIGALLKGPEILGSTPEVCAQRNGVSLYGAGPTLRAAVSGLKAAWRDAVRPWVVEAAEQADLECGFGATDGNTRERLVARVLKEDS
jgi:hypothetical protein